MKKISRIIAGTLLAAGISFAQQVQIGGHAAVNFSTLWGDGASEMEVPWSLGILAGVAVKVPVNEKVCVVPEMNVDWRRQKDDEITWNTWAIEVPVLARYSVVPQVYLEAGPQLGFLLSSEIERKFDTGPGAEKIKLGDRKVDALHIFEIGLDAGVGFSVAQNLDLDIRFAVGLNSIVDGKKFDNDDQAFKNMQIQIGGTYWFK